VKKIIIIYVILNWCLAIAIFPITSYFSGFMKLNIIGTVTEFKNQGIIDQEKLQHYKGGIYEKFPEMIVAPPLESLQETSIVLSVVFGLNGLLFLWKSIK